MSVRTERYLVAKIKTGRTVRDHLVVTSHDMTAGNQLPGLARPIELITDDEKADRSVFDCRLD